MRAMLMSLTLMAVGLDLGAAQTPASVPPGSTVRLSIDCTGEAPGPRQRCRRERGIVVQADALGLTWRPQDGSAVETEPWAAIGAVEVSRGKRRHVLKGLLIGAAVGAVPGALSGAAYAETCDCSDPNYAGGAAIGALIFAVPGAVLGAGIGALVRTEAWDEVPKDGLRVSIVPIVKGAGLGVALRF